MRFTVHLVVSLGLFGACARAVYTCVKDTEVPGACPPDTVEHGSFAMMPDSSAPRDSIIGRVVAQFDGKPIQNARVFVTSDTAVVVLTDSTGRFAAPRPAASWIMRAAMLGYRQRVDTITVDAATRSRLQIGLEAQGTDGPCSGFAMVCTKR